MSDLIAPSTFSQTVAGSPKTKGEMFNAKIQIQSNNKDVFKMMEGDENSGRPFIVKTDLTKGGGQTVNFTTVTEIDGIGRVGEQTLVGFEDNPDFGSYNCTVDIWRNATAWTAKMQAFMATGKTIEGTYGQILGNWFGRKKQYDMMMKLRASATGRNTLFVNNKQFDQLLSTDCLSTSVITSGKALLSGLGASSCNLTKKKSRAGSEIFSYLFFGTHVALNSLKSNGSYLTAAEYAQERGDNNTIFAGGYTNWDGNAIYEYTVKDPDGAGPIGAPILPRALLGTAVAASDAVFAATGGGKPTASTKHPLRFFLGYDYQYIEGQDAYNDPNTYYFVILNVSGAAAGKFGVYSYQGSANNGQQITITNRLRAAAAGASVTTLAGQTWNATIHTDSHPTGSLIFQVNAKCTTVGWSYMFGAAAVVRAYGNLGGSFAGKSLTHTVEVGDHGMKRSIGMAVCYGQSPTQDTRNQPRNYILIPHAVQHPEAPASLNITS